MPRFNRRQFLITAVAATAGTLFLHSCGQNNDQAQVEVEIDPADAPETPTVRLGFIALTDSAPLIIAKEKGFFTKYGMTEVSLEKQASWGTTRDNLVLGSKGGGIDGAHILTPMPYLLSEGIVTDGRPVPMYILARLNVNGQGICLSKDYLDLEVGVDSSPLKERFAERRAAGADLRAAMTFPGGTHDCWIRYWLAAGGIDPDQDISTIVVPPPQMVANMRVGNMDAFCVGEPWPLQLVNQEIGYNALTTGQLWQDHPEKSFGMRADWVDQNPKAARALLMATLEAQIWCSQPENVEEMCQILSRRSWFNVPFEDIIDRSRGIYNDGIREPKEQPQLMQKYWLDNASYPFKSHELWFLTENIRWGYLPPDADIQGMVNRVNRDDLWQEAADAIGQGSMIPKSSSRGPETFFDGKVFDPEKPLDYLKSLEITRI
ncbi:CmpA/NrtA family ABC transporter substrate-binding protein [Laspinema olomoucense]|uniref:CmpA/NrtA family ABC transporter substrate-binding protein n=1 Tax=Laspinema olomoucense TaxID=3231600 RepID=UPI0021BB4C52|nr:MULTISPECIES: CmpA/NrtA family ABC transporter substrate-binding protein [unclassified Laspinema]MCT7970939.1 ABC transporter substrate-binding protein [Laspinema sp. D3d]MCT7995746.1 ABC transporter substrate-binding protein [Laspinema sp. D3c]